MTTSPFRPFALAGVASLLLALLPGCVILLEGDDDDEITNEIPFIYEDEDSTYWACGLDEGMGEYSFEFQTVVDDLDGLADVDQVNTTVFSAQTGGEIDSFQLIDEGGGVYGGLVWESETDLYCGEPIDVTFEVWDLMGDSYSFTLYY